MQAPFLSLLPILALSVLPSRPAASPAHPSPFESTVDRREEEVYRIRKHLAKVEEELRREAPRGLTEAQGRARAARLADLHAYREAGIFPSNPTKADTLHPVFIDARGVACAVGQLVIASGRRDLAEDIAGAANHAYIPEIGDARLPEWARANGLTLEECARIQPSYASHYSDVMGLALDSRNRPWIATGNGVSAAGCFLSRFGADGWKTPISNLQSGYQAHCMVGERPLVVGFRGMSWNGAAPADPEGGAITYSHCAPGPDGKSFWLGSRQGLRRYSVGDTGAPRLEETVLGGSETLPSDTVIRLAMAGNRVWVGTSQGIAHQAAGGAWVRHAEALVGNRLLGGLEAGGGKGVWFGAYKSQESWIRLGYPPFSETGLHWQDEEGASVRYHRGNSPLPSDTIRMVAAAPDHSVWLICDLKTLLHFKAPDRLTTLPFTLPDYVNSIEVDSDGRLYIGTYAPKFGGRSSATGLYRLEGDSLVWLGYPNVASSIGRSGRGDGFFSGGGGLRPRLDARGPFLSGLDVLGRQSDRVSAAGMYRMIPAR